MRGGGSYFIISRSLGPEAGGAIGVLFYLAYGVGSTFYTIGFATEVQETWYPERAGQKWFLLAISSMVLAVILVVSLIGASFFTKINVVIFVIQFGAILLSLFSMMFGPDKERHTPGTEHVAWNRDTLYANAKPDYSRDDQCGGKMCDFRLVFAIVWPAVSGIMEGANLSGDLKNPVKSIPKGTLWAIFVSIITYVVLIFTMGGSFPRQTLKDNMIIMQESAYPTQYLVVIGIAVSAASSALGAVFGGSRVLQALARDDLIPGLKWLGLDKGSKDGDEPRRAVICTWALAQLCLFIGDLDVVAPIISSFFCLTYGTVNFTCLMLKMSGTINFRPTWKYWSVPGAVIGVILNFAVMIWINVYYAMTTLGLMIGIFIYLLYRGPVTAWGDVTQAIVYHQVRKYLLRLDARATHGKLWRPSVLLLSDGGPLIEFCNALKKGGLYIVSFLACLFACFCSSLSLSHTLSLSRAFYLSSLFI
jgi:potassium/chloride transporter 9